METLTDFLKDRKQIVALNEQNSSWVNVQAGVPQCSILSLLLFLIYINIYQIIYNKYKFADDTSLVSAVHDSTTSSCDLNYDLYRVGEWTFQWKMRALILNLQNKLRKSYLCESFKKRLLPL